MAMRRLFAGVFAGYRAPRLAREQIMCCLQGRYPNMSWDDMLRSLSDPIYQYDAQGNPYSHQVQNTLKTCIICPQYHF